MEEWRPTVGFDGYEVSNLGRVRRSKPGPGARAGLVLKWQRDTRNYPMVHLWVSGKRHGIKVHRLVAEAFLGPKPTPKHTVAHNDGNPQNAAASNLRWATHWENHQDRFAHGTDLCGERSPVARLRDADIPVIRHLRASGATVKSIAVRYGVHRETIGALLRGRSWGRVA